MTSLERKNPPATRRTGSGLPSLGVAGGAQRARLPRKHMQREYPAAVTDARGLARLRGTPCNGAGRRRSLLRRRRRISRGARPRPRRRGAQLGWQLRPRWQSVTGCSFPTFPATRGSCRGAGAARSGPVRRRGARDRRAGGRAARGRRRALARRRRRRPPRACATAVDTSAIVLLGSAGISSSSRRTEAVLAVTSLLQPGRPRRAVRVVALRDAVSPPPRLRRLGASPTPARLPPASVEALLAERRRCTRTFPVRRGRSCATTSRRLLPAVRCPAIVAWGARDVQVPVGDAFEYARGLGAELRLIADCGHLLIVRASGGVRRRDPRGCSARPGSAARRTPTARSKRSPSRAASACTPSRSVA